MALAINRLKIKQSLLSSQIGLAMGSKRLLPSLLIGYPVLILSPFSQVLQRYTEITPLINLAGPTSFAPLIRFASLFSPVLPSHILLLLLHHLLLLIPFSSRQAIAMVQYAQSYHILIIIADGQLTPDSEFGRPTSETIDAIVGPTPLTG